MASQAKAALSTFEIENNVQSLDSSSDKNLIDSIYKYDEAEQNQILDSSPWSKEYVSSLQIHIILFYLYHVATSY